MGVPAREDRWVQEIRDIDTDAMVEAMHIGTDTFRFALASIRTDLYDSQDFREATKGEALRLIKDTIPVAQELTIMKIMQRANYGPMGEGMSRMDDLQAAFARAACDFQRATESER